MTTDRKVVGIIQARMGSTRLPGKVLAEIYGQPMLMTVYLRAARAGQLDEMWVATSSLGEDDPIAEMCQAAGIACFRGHPTDVLDRVYQTAKQAAAAIVVRLTADCPLIDSGLIDRTVRLFIEAEPPVDFAANRLPNIRSFPIGLDVEVCSFDALSRAWESATEPYQREHVMPYIYQNPTQFRIKLLHHPEDLSSYRWTVDEQADLDLVRRVYGEFSGQIDFDWREVLDLMSRRPDLALLNAGVQQRGLPQ